MGTGLNLEHTSRAAKDERNWMPVAIAAAIVVLAVVLIVVLSQQKKTSLATPVSAPLDPYAASLSLDGLTLSESSNLAGGKVTYIDGVITNRGGKTVVAVAVQALFRSEAGEVARNVTQPLRLIRTRTPYVDVKPLSAEPLKPGGQREFRLIFDGVNPNWNGRMPELRAIRVALQ
jgi:hypothetical protein